MVAVAAITAAAAAITAAEAMMAEATTTSKMTSTDRGGYNTTINYGKCGLRLKM